VLCAFSVLDERASASHSLLDAFRIVGESFKEWLGDGRMLFTTTLQTATLCAGFFFLYEGTLQWCVPQLYPRRVPAPSRQCLACDCVASVKRDPERMSHGD